MADLTRLLQNNEQLHAASRIEQLQACGAHRALENVYHSKGETEEVIYHLKVALGISSSLNKVLRKSDDRINGCVDIPSLHLPFVRSLYRYFLPLRENSLLYSPPLIHTVPYLLSHHLSIFYIYNPSYKGIWQLPHALID